MDFQGLNARLLQQAENILPKWLPGGRFNGKEYVCAGIGGGKGRSFSVNTKTGAWGEFENGGEGGLDLISLWAKITNTDNVKSYQDLADSIAYQGDMTPIVARKNTITFPPPNAPRPDFGSAAGVWAYRDKNGELMFYVARYESPNGKIFIPFSWDAEVSNWVKKSWPNPRPLYGLDALAQAPDSPVLVVEGEKAAEAAKKMVGNQYVVMTWPNGSNAVEKASWKPLKGRDVLIWPDNDEAGIAAAKKISEIIPSPKSVKVIDPSDMAPKWDAADAIIDGMTEETFEAWATARIQKPTAVALASASATVNIEEASTSNAITVSHREEWGRLGISVTQRGTPISNMDSVLKVLEGREEFIGTIWFDEFLNQIYTTWDWDSNNCAGKARPWKDLDEMQLTLYMQRKLGLERISDDQVKKACFIFANRNIKNEPRDWMDSLVWDGKERIESLFPHYFGAEVNEYTVSVGRNFLLGMVARVYYPGCQVDYMPVLEGEQGFRKSTSLLIIGGKWAAESTRSVLDKDFYLELQGKLLVIFNEMHNLSRAEHTVVKNMITTRHDRYRTPYGKLPQDYPRCGVFAGTTNEHSWLRDHTGDRRYWPIRTVGMIRTDELQADRDQLFAEAVQKIKAGNKWHLFPEALARKEQAERRQEDPWEETILQYISNMEKVSTEELYGPPCLDHPKARRTRSDALRIGQVMTALGWEKDKPLWDGENKKTLTTWKRKAW